MYLFLNLFIFDCAGSLVGAALRCGAWASHRDGFSCCGVWALEQVGFSSCSTGAQ